MANHRTYRKQINIYVSEKAIENYKMLQENHIRVALLVEDFLIRYGEAFKNKDLENELDELKDLEKNIRLL